MTRTLFVPKPQPEKNSYCRATQVGKVIDVGEACQLQPHADKLKQNPKQQADSGRDAQWIEEEESQQDQEAGPRELKSVEGHDAGDSSTGSNGRKGGVGIDGDVQDIASQRGQKNKPEIAGSSQKIFHVVAKHHQEVQIA